MTMELVGMADLRRSLDELERRALVGGLRGVLATAHRIEAEAKHNAPVAQRRGGTLRRSIGVREPTISGDSVAVEVGPSVVYARRLELGFHGTDSLGRSYEQDGQPYLGPAVEKVRPKYPDILADFIGAELRQLGI